MTERFLTRAEARALGATRYNDGKPCIHGHMEGRYTNGNDCIVCTRFKKRVQRSRASSPAKAIDRLSERARQEAISLGLAKNHHVLRYAASHDTADLQVKALHSEVARKAAKQARQREQEATVASQAAAATATPKAIQLIDQRRDAARAYWSWLIEECGVKAYPIVSRLRDMDIPVLLDEVERLRTEGVDGNPKPALH